MKINVDFSSYVAEFFENDKCFHKTCRENRNIFYNKFS